jgi:hypothetical protein
MQCKGNLLVLCCLVSGPGPAHRSRSWCLNSGKVRTCPFEVGSTCEGFCNVTAWTPRPPVGTVIHILTSCHRAPGGVLHSGSDTESEEVGERCKRAGIEPLGRGQQLNGVEEEEEMPVQYEYSIKLRSSNRLGRLPTG